MIASSVLARSCISLCIKHIFIDMCIFVNPFVTIDHWQFINFVLLGTDFIEISSPKLKISTQLKKLKKLMYGFFYLELKICPRTDCAGLFSVTVSMLKNLVCWPLAAIVENENIIILKK